MKPWLTIGGAALLAIVLAVAFGFAFLGGGASAKPAGIDPATGKPIDWDPRGTVDWEARQRAKELAQMRDDRTEVAAPGKTDTPSTADEPGYEAVPWSALVGFSYQPPQPGVASTPLPESVTRLNGTKCRIVGYMMPTQMSGSLVKAFLLMRTQVSCCYAQPMTLQDWIVVRVEPGVEVRPDIRPVTVLGTLEAGEEIENGAVISLYRMKATKAEAR